MEFKVVEGAYKDIDKIYLDFENDYLNTTISNPKLKKKYDLNNREWKEITAKVKKENGISRRPRHYNGKYYYFQGKGYAIRKYVNGKLHHFGTVPTEEIAIKIVKICENVLWDIDKCYAILDKWYEYVV